MNDRGALAGIRVLDLSRVLAGPWATQIMGDLGAEVIKIERPGSGDDTRAWGPPDFRDAGYSAYYASANRNKRSVTDDIAKSAGQQLIAALAQQSDVLVENYKVGSAARHGLERTGHHGPVAAMGVPRDLLPHWDSIQVITAQLARFPLLDDHPVEHDQLATPARLRNQGQDVAQRPGSRHLAGQAHDCAILGIPLTVLARVAHEHDVIGRG